jgi:transposase
VIKLRGVVMILDLHRQGLSISVIARELGIDRKTVRRTIAGGLEPPMYGPRKPRPRRIDPFVPYLRERVTAYPGLTGQRLWRELRERGYAGGYTAVTDLLRELRPRPLPAFEVRFEKLAVTNQVCQRASNAHSLGQAFGPFRSRAPHRHPCHVSLCHQPVSCITTGIGGRSSIINKPGGVGP